MTYAGFGHSLDWFCPLDGFVAVVNGVVVFKVFSNGYCIKSKLLYIDLKSSHLAKVL